MHHLVVIAAATRRSLANPWSIACASSRGLAALRLLQRLPISCRLPLAKVSSKRPPHPSGCKTLENTSKARRTRARRGLRGSTALELSTSDSTNARRSYCENPLLHSTAATPRPVVANEAHLAAARDPCTARPKKRTNCAPPVGQKLQNINKEALQTVRPRTWRSVRSTPHQ